MKQYLIFLFFFLIISCDKPESKEKTKETIIEKPSEKEPVTFNKIIFSFEPGWSNDKRSKDIEISWPDSVFFRTREDNRILENFKAKLSAGDQKRVIAILDSINFNDLKYGFDHAHDAPYFSFKFIFEQAEVSMQGTLEKSWDNQIFALYKLVNKQNFVPSKNRKFVTAKDVLLPQPPGQIDSSFLPHDSL